MSECVLKTSGLVKIYSGQKVLNEVDMTVNKGDIYGFVGENGSGKTTIIRILSGLIRPNAGSFELFGVKSNDPKIYEVRRKLGAVVESPSIYPALNARDNLKELSLILGINDEEKIKKTLELVGLGSMYDNPKKAVDYSLGMRQRLGIAMALLSDAEFMVLDEPLNGVDPEGIVGLRNLILNLNKEKGITFLISSHILSELSLVATKYGIISKGHLLKEITKEELDAVCKKCIVIDTLEKDKLYEALL
ncbi:MAG: ATP-binding cassette domain-containing protein, partial [Acholeplasmatales bacterium]|nr:ATP-binding cassette domain-containing protein [Acholeplasmatales bacterium]